MIGHKGIIMMPIWGLKIFSLGALGFSTLAAIDPIAFTAYATPTALVIVALVQALVTLRVGQVKEIVVNVEKQTNNRLTALMDEVAGLKATISKNASTHIQEQLNGIQQTVDKTRSEATSAQVQAATIAAIRKE